MVALRALRGRVLLRVGLACALPLGLGFGCGRPPQQEPRKLPPGAGPKDEADEKKRKPKGTSEPQPPKVRDPDPDHRANSGEDPVAAPDETAGE